MEKIWKAPKGYVEKKYNYVYKLTLKDDCRYFYIGKRSTNLDQDPYMGSGKGLSYFRERYGKDCFVKEILSYWPTAAEALEEERKLVTVEMICNPFCINRVKGGGTFDTTGRHLSEEHKKVLSERAKQHPRSLEFLQNVGRIHKGMKMSKEACTKNSEARKNEIWVNKGDVFEKRKLSEWPELEKDGWVRRRKPFSEETKQKMRLAKLGKKQSSEHIKNRSLGMKRFWEIKKSQENKVSLGI